MKLSAFKLTALAIILSTATGCSTMQGMGDSIKNMDKSDIGMWVGGVAAGALCLYATAGQSIAVQGSVGATCAGIGALLGNAIGKTLDQRDQAALQAKTQQALNSNKEGVTTWTSPTSGATAKLEVSKPTIKKEIVSVKRNIDVQPVAEMTKLNAQYITLKSSTVRLSPSTSGKRVSLLKPQTEFTAIGKTGNWIGVSVDDKLVGFVSADLVESKATADAKAAAKVAAKAPAPAPAPTTAPKANESAVVQKVETVSVPAFKLDKITAANDPEMAKMVDQPVVAEKVETTTTCKTLTSTITNAKGKSDTNSSVQCKNPVVDAWADA